MGEICQRWLKIPPVIGELLAGVAIGPFALGQFGITRDFGSLFPLPIGFPGQGGLPVSNELWSIGQIGAIVLLFAAGLATNRKLFVRYIGPGALVAAGQPRARGDALRQRYLSTAIMAALMLEQSGRF